MVKIDKTAPTCSVNINGVVGSNGWYKQQDVGLSLSTNDSGGSSVTSYGLTTSSTTSYNSVTSASQSNTTGVIWYGYVRDGSW